MVQGKEKKVLEESQLRAIRTAQKSMTRKNQIKAMLPYAQEMNGETMTRTRLERLLTSFPVSSRSLSKEVGRTIFSTF
jgi:hypothetical protein